MVGFRSERISPDVWNHCRLCVRKRIHTCFRVNIPVTLIASDQPQFVNMKRVSRLPAPEGH